jgi:hypothetical protein
MISNPRIGLPLAGLLIAILSFEWRTPLPAATAAVLREARAGGAIAAGTPARQRATLGRYVSAISARPLFAPDRRPKPQPRTDRAFMSPSLPRLAGIVIAASQLRAIFEADGKPIVRSAGGDLDGYRIVAIEARIVTVRGPFGEQTADVSFDENRAVPQPFVYRMARSRPSILDQLNTGRRHHFPCRAPPIFKPCRRANAKCNNDRQGGMKYFLFKIAQQETFDGSRMRPGATNRVKVFWFFFSRKNCFLARRARWNALACTVLYRYVCRFTHAGARLDRLARPA